jgi:hypothetical protein
MEQWPQLLQLSQLLHSSACWTMQTAVPTASTVQHEFVHVHLPFKIAAAAKAPNILITSRTPSTAGSMSWVRQQTLRGA